MKMAILPVSAELLRDALHLPPDAEITGAYCEPSKPGRICLVVRHPDLAPVKEGAEAPQVQPMFVTHYDESGGPRIEFKSW